MKCSFAAPPYISLAEKYSRDVPHVREGRVMLAAMNCVKFSSLCDQKGIKAYPTITLV